MTTPRRMAPAATPTVGALAFDRRTLFVGAALVVLAGCGSGEPEPNLVTLGDIGEIRRRASEAGGAYFLPEHRAWIGVFPGSTAEEAGGGLIAVSRQCPEEGCAVTFCAESRLYQCPCCRSEFDIAGTYHSGVAPRGLDFYPFPLRVNNDVVVADFGGVFRGDPRPDDVEKPTSALTCV